MHALYLTVTHCKQVPEYNIQFIKFKEWEVIDSEEKLLYEQLKLQFFLLALAAF